MTNTGVIPAREDIKIQETMNEWQSGEEHVVSGWDYRILIPLSPDKQLFRALFNISWNLIQIIESHSQRSIIEFFLYIFPILRQRGIGKLEVKWIIVRRVPQEKEKE